MVGVTGVAGTRAQVETSDVARPVAVAVTQPGSARAKVIEKAPSPLPSSVAFASPAFRCAHRSCAVQRSSVKISRVSCAFLSPWIRPETVTRCALRRTASRVTVGASEVDVPASTRTIAPPAFAEIELARTTVREVRVMDTPAPPLLAMTFAAPG